MPHPPEQKCSNCLYYVPFVDEPDDENRGECRRNAPVAAPSSNTALELDGDNWAWPFVSKDHWCGDYSPGPVDNRSPATETAIAAEREECAKVAEEWTGHEVAECIAREIRARGQS